MSRLWIVLAAVVAISVPTGLAHALGAAPSASAWVAPGPVQVTVPRAAGARLAATTSDWFNLTYPANSFPSCRDNYGVADDSYDGYILYFGGGLGCDASSSAVAGDTWTYRNGSWTNLSGGLSVEPSARWGIAMAYDAADNEVVLFGGMDSFGSPLGDTWVFSNGSWRDISSGLSQAPSARFGAVMAYDSADGYLVMFGGQDGYYGQYFNDTWEFHSGSWTNLSATTAPAPRRAAFISSDPADSGVLLFGGYDSGLRSDTWVYSAGAWAKASPTRAPSPRSTGEGMYDSRDQVVVLYGGCTAASCLASAADTWTFTGGQWTNVSSSLGSSPGALGGGMLVWDSEDGYGLLLDGRGASARFAQVWAYPDFPLSVGLSPTSPEGEVGLVLQITAIPLGGQPPYTFTYLGLPPGCSGGNATTVTCIPLQSGKYPATVYLNDTAGASASARFNVTVFPRLSVSVTATPSALIKGNSTTIVTTTSGGAGGFSYTYSGLPTPCVSVNAPTLSCSPNETGGFVVNLTVADRLLATVASSVTMQVYGPMTVGQLPAVVQTEVGRAVVLNVSVGGGSGTYTFDWTGLPGSCPGLNTSTLSCTPKIAGNYSVSVAVTDSIGTSSVLSTNLKVAPALQATLVVSPEKSDLGQSVLVSAGASGGFGIQTYAWSNLPPGCALSGTGGYCQSVAAGNFTIELVVADGLGVEIRRNASVVVAPTIQVQGGASILGACSPPIMVDFQAQVSGGTRPYAYYWSFGDHNATHGSSPAVNHSYESQGTYTATLVVTDAVAENATTVIPVAAVGTAGCSTSGGSSVWGWLGGPALLGALLAALAVIAASVAAVVLHRRRLPPAGGARAAP